MKNRRMKTLFVGLLVSLLAKTAFAQSQGTRNFDFFYRVNGQPLKISAVGKSYEEAFEKAAKDCFSQLGGGRKISEDTGLAIIDVCANPRTM